MSRWPFVVKRPVQASLPLREEVPYSPLCDPAEVRDLTQEPGDLGRIEGVLLNLRAQADATIDEIPDASLEP